MIRSAVLVAGLALGGMLLPALAQVASADATIVSSSVENGYPKQLTFKLTAQSPANITDVTLKFALAGSGSSSIGKPSELTPAKTISTEVVVQVNSGSAYIPVASEFLYHWEVTSDDGTTTVGPELRFLFLPPNQDWQTARSELAVVYYHGNQQAAASAFLKAIGETYDRIGKGLLQTTLKQLPVKAVYFNSEKEMSEATAGRGDTFDQAVTNCGQRPANSSDIIFLNPARCGSDDQTDTLRHEFTHILTKAAGEGALGKLPSWLDEGTAVYGQTDPGQDYVGSFQAAVRSNRLIPFAQMGTPSNDPRLVGLFYGESYMMTKYLIDKGGQAKFAQFYATIKKGERFDDALKQVYGFDMAGFENDFRAANNLAPAANPTAVPTSQQQGSQPTAVATSRQQGAQPTAAPTTRPAVRTTTDGSGDSGLSTPMLIAIGVAVLFALLAVFAFLLSQMLANTRRQTASGPTNVPPADWSRPGEGPKE